MRSLWNNLTLSPSEYGEFYRGYIQKIGDENILDLLENQGSQLYKLIQSLDTKQLDERYAPGKWSLRQLFGHLIDCERIFGSRALHISRGNTQELPGFDQNRYAETGNFQERSRHSLAEEYRALRKANLLLFESFDTQMMNRIGTANETRVSARAIAVIIAGHERHHLEVMQEKYGLSIPDPEA